MTAAQQDSPNGTPRTGGSDNRTTLRFDVNDTCKMDEMYTFHHIFKNEQKGRVVENKLTIQSSQTKKDLKTVIFHWVHHFPTDKKINNSLPEDSKCNCYRPASQQMQSSNDFCFSHRN